MNELGRTFRNRFGLAVVFFIAGARVLLWGQTVEERQRPIDGMMDNSFLIEEAYNQEAGVVQHIFNGALSFNRVSEGSQRRVDFSFTQEWPAYGQAHQFSYTAPYSGVREGGKWSDGLGDVLLNYRYQAYLDEKTLTGFSPRFSFVLPTGDERKGFGNGTLGYQCNLPFSTTFGDRWFAHANGGLTFLPRAGQRPGHDLMNYNLGASAIYCPSGRLNFMLEWAANWNQGLAGSGEVERQFGAVISPGLRYTFNLEKEIQIVVGAAMPIGLTRTTPDIGLFIYFSVEHRMFGKAAR